MNPTSHHAFRTSQQELTHRANSAAVLWLRLRRLVLSTQNTSAQKLTLALHIEGLQVIIDAQLFQNQNGIICVLAMCPQDSADVQMRTFEIIGTGNPITDANANRNYIGTVQQDQFVWHVFERV